MIVSVEYLALHNNRNSFICVQIMTKQIAKLEDSDLLIFDLLRLCLFISRDLMYVACVSLRKITYVKYAINGNFKTPAPLHRRCQCLKRY